MANKPLSMHKVRQILLFLKQGASQRSIEKEVKTGEFIECPVFIGVLPFSSFDYVEALHDATLPQVLKALNNALEYFGCIHRRYVTPDSYYFTPFKKQGNPSRK